MGGSLLKRGWIRSWFLRSFDGYGCCCVWLTDDAVALLDVELKPELESSSGRDHLDGRAS